MKHRSFLRQILRGAAISAVALAVLPNAGTTQQLDLSREVADVKRHIASPQLGSALDFVETQIADPSDVIQDWIGVCNALGPIDIYLLGAGAA